MKRIIPFPRGKIKMTTIEPDGEVPRIKFDDGLISISAPAGLTRVFKPTESDLIEALKFDQAKINQEQADKAKALSDFTRVVEQAGILKTDGDK